MTSRNNNNNNNTNRRGTDATIDLSMPAVPMATAVPIPWTTGHAASSSLPPVAAYNDNPELEKQQLSALQGQGFPAGLAAELGQTRAAYPLRFWVVDNSGKKERKKDILCVCVCVCIQQASRSKRCRNTLCDDG